MKDFENLVSIQELQQQISASTTVYFHSNDAKNEQIAKLILLFGKDKFEELLNDEKIEFQRLCDFEVNNSKDTDIEEYEMYKNVYLGYDKINNMQLT